MKSFMTKQKMRAIFNQFDTDNTGLIDSQNIVYALQKIGQDISKSEVEEMMMEHDLNGDNVIDFEEFEHIFLGK